MYKNSSKFYFGPGPCSLPLEVRKKIFTNMWDIDDYPASVLETSHHYPSFRNHLQDIKKKFREVLHVPSNYRVLFISGGARQQYGNIPLNLRSSSSKILCINSGYWSKVMSNESTIIWPESEYFHYDIYGNNDSLSSKSLNYNYVHLVTNETIDGVMLPHPLINHGGLIADMTSDLCMRKFSMDSYAIVYAATQKSLGIAGMSVVIIRDDILERCVNDRISTFQNYKFVNSSSSLGVTPPTFTWWTMGVMLDWIKDKGGIDFCSSRQKRRSKIIYDLVDRYDVYMTNIPCRYRSMHNICFTFCSDSIQDAFFNLSCRMGIYGLNGHKSSGGVRINLYLGIEEDSFDRLVELMVDFGERYK